MHQPGNASACGQGFENGTVAMMLENCEEHMASSIDARTSLAKPGWPPVLVGGTSQTAVVLMRDLAQRGLSVSCVGSNTRANGFKSVYGKGLKVADPDDSPEEWLKEMLRVARQLGNRPVLIATGDHYVTAIARYAVELHAVFRIPPSASGPQRQLSTKLEQYAAAQTHGMPVPGFRVVENVNDLMEFAANATFPCLIKPYSGRQWEFGPVGFPLRGCKIALANSPEELIAKYLSAATIDASVVVQEVIQGPDTAKRAYLSCYSTKGDRVAACIMRALRTHPIGYGSASVVEPVIDREVDSVCDRFLRSMNYSGLCEIELKRDDRDGGLRMIEANPRYSGTSDAATYAGVPLGWIHYLDLIGETPIPIVQADRYFRHITLYRDVPTVGKYIAAGKCTWVDVLRSYWPPVAFFDLSFRDWRLSGKTMVFILRFMLGRIYRRVFPRQ